MLKKIAVTLLFALAQLIVITVFAPRGAAENIPSPSLKILYKIESEYIHLSEFPNNFILYDVIVIDIDAERMREVDVVTADLYLPLVPEELNDIILFDGYHAAHFAFERISETCLRIHAKSEDLACFDGTVGLYLFVTGIK